MALPVLNAAKYRTMVPSLGKEVEYRPYLVKEEKILMIAIESQDQRQILGALKDVIKACVIDDIDIDNLAMFDIETLFLKLRSKSVGESTEIRAKCSECDTPNKQLVKFDDIEIPTIKKGKMSVALTKDVGITLKYPSITVIEESDSENMESYDAIIELIINCIDSIYDADNVYSAKDEGKKELLAFVEALNSDQFGKLTEFFRNIPSLKYTLKYDCSKCGHKNELELKGIESFFG
jgi:ribosomal protein L44E